MGLPREERVIGDRRICIVCKTTTTAEHVLFRPHLQQMYDKTRLAELLRKLCTEINSGLDILNVYEFQKIAKLFVFDEKR